MSGESGQREEEKQKERRKRKRRKKKREKKRTSLGQQDGHFLPGIYTGLVPAAQKPSSAKHSQVWSLVWLRLFPGQQAPDGHVQGTLSHPGQILPHWLSVGSTGGGLQKPMEAKQSQALFFWRLRIVRKKKKRILLRVKRKYWKSSMKTGQKKEEKEKIRKRNKKRTSLGQQDGHFLPGVYTGVLPAAQKPSCAKQLQLLSGVVARELPGQQESLQSHGTVSQPGQSLEQMLEVGSLVTLNVAVARARVEARVNSVVNSFMVLFFFSQQQGVLFVSLFLCC